MFNAQVFNTEGGGGILPASPALCGLSVASPAPLWPLRPSVASPGLKNYFLTFNTFRFTLSQFAHPRGLPWAADRQESRKSGAEMFKFAPRFAGGFFVPCSVQNSFV